MESGDEIRCEPEDLGGVLDKFEVIESDPTPPEPEPEPTVGLIVVLRDNNDASRGFDVLNETTRQRLNDAPLTEEAARELADGMTNRLSDDADDEEVGKNDGDDE